MTLHLLKLGRVELYTVNLITATNTARLTVAPFTVIYPY
jgi:hypothetical protein